MDQITTMTATIHFVGLVLFTSFNPMMQRQTTGTTTSTTINQSRVIAIMPNVPRPADNTQTAPTTTTAAPAPAPAKSGAVEKHDAARQVGDPIVIDLPQDLPVEEHMAAIAFKPCDLIAVNGWEINRLDSQFLYIKLKGEQISFVAIPPAGPSSIDKRMMHAKGPQLADGYQWPYSAAAAVFDLGRSVVTACMSGATTSNQDPITRVDAEVVLANAGTVTIKETGGKSLTLRGDAFVVALNVPPPWALHHLADPKSEKNHFKVYCAMTGDTDCEWPLMRPKIPPFPGPCTDTSNLRPAGAPPPPDALPELTKAADLFCSTSSWP